jgi:hypothetical protein
MSVKQFFSWVVAIAVSFGALSHNAQAASNDWEVISTDDGFITKRKSVEGSSILAFRGETVVDTPIAKILSVFLDASRRGEWVDKFHTSAELTVKNEWERTYWIRFGLPFPISDRDYVLNASAQVDEARRVVTANIKSVEHSKKPQDDCCVRASAMGTYYRFEAIPGTNKTKMEVEVHTDPKGMLPSWLVNIIQKKWPSKTLLSLARVASDAAVEPHPSFIHWNDKELPAGLVQADKVTPEVTAQAKEDAADKKDTAATEVTDTSATNAQQPEG